MNMKERIIELLLALGDTADKVAKTLASLGIKGNRQECNSCPIAIYLARNESKLFDVEVTTYCIASCGQQYYLNNVPNDILDRLKGVTNFINKFDDGTYPELVA